MPHYVILPAAVTAAHVDQISRKLYALSRPAAVRKPGDVTTHYAALLRHTDGRLALVLPDEDLPLHPSLDRDDLWQYLRTRLTPTQIDNMRARIVARIGQRDHPRQFLVELVDALRSGVRTREQMLADGWPIPTE
jgi:hypothetical protein